jgi:hypothetical protein
LIEQTANGEAEQYCSDKCRFEHLELHAALCTPAYASERWAPDVSTIENLPREAAQVGTSLWGTFPAVDILSLDGGDPTAYNEDVNLLLPSKTNRCPLV